MAKKESTIRNMAVALLLITAVAGFAMAAVYSLTKETIAASKKAKVHAAIKKGLPDYDVLSDTLLMPEDGHDSITIHRLCKTGAITGFAVETYTEKGYSGRFNLLVGFNTDGSISHIEVLDHHETPGIGTKITLPAFTDQFKGLNLSHVIGGKLKITEDGGTVDAITAATVSSRAFCDAVNRADAINRKGRRP